MSTLSAVFYAADSIISVRSISGWNVVVRGVSKSSDFPEAAAAAAAVNCDQNFNLSHFVRKTDSYWTS